MDALAAGHDAAVQMIDTSVIRVHQHGACIADNNYQDMGWSRGGLTSKIHALVDTNGLPVHLALTHGKAHDNRLCSVLLSALLPPTMLLADRGYDADLDQGACTPSDVIAKLNAAIMDALADPVVHQRLANLGQEVFPREQQTPQALGASKLRLRNGGRSLRRRT